MMTLKEKTSDTTTIPRGETSAWIYEQLKTDILTGKIEAGAMLSETTIAREYGVSRTPVRDALSALVSDRLVKTLPQRGHLVRTITYLEIVEAFRLREVLEVEAAGLAAERVTDAEIESLKQFFDEDHLKDPLLWNYQFHARIGQLSGNRLLADFIEETLLLMQGLLIKHPRMGIGREYAEPEWLVLAAIETRNPETARNAMRQHIQEAREQMLGQK